jgi:cyclic nucleotide-binding protein
MRVSEGVFPFIGRRFLAKSGPMQPDNDAPGFCIWGVDNVVYGPVDLPTLINWVQEERVAADTWIYLRDKAAWERAPGVSELQMFFQPKSAAGASARKIAAPDGTAITIKPGSLRRVKILAGMNDQQLDRFVEFMELQRIRQWEEIVKQGSPGDAMYLVLEGEVRVRLMVAGKESILVTLAAGEFFGEIALFDHGPRSADVVANQDGLLLKISASAFQRLVSEAPDLAAPFLFAIGNTLIARIRADNKRYRETIAFARTARE